MASTGLVKISLLNVLANGRPSIFKTHSAVCTNGLKTVEPTLRVVSSCAQQKHFLTGSKTVINHFRFKATLPKNPGCISHEQVEQNKAILTQKNQSVTKDLNGTAQEVELINWAKEYLAKDRELLKLNAMLKEVYEKLEQALREQAEAGDIKANLLEQALREQAEAGDIKANLKYANDEILRLHSMLSARGVIEYFDKKSQMPMNKRALHRNQRYEYIFHSNPLFREQLQNFFGRIPDAVKVGSLAEKVFTNTSADVHSFDKTKGVQISAVNYSKDEVKFLQSVCATVPCHISIE